LGYEETVRELSWYSPSLMVPGGFKIEGGVQAVEALLARHPDIDGIFAGNDLMAIGALKKLHKLGIKVPQDIAICGFDGIAITEVTEPELTTVAQPIYEMGRLAAETLIRQVETGLAESKVYELEVALMKRASTKKG